MHSITLVVLTAVIASAVGQGPPEPPTWFLYDLDQDNVDFDVRVAECEQAFPANQENSSQGTIIIPEESNHADICIKFPAIPERGLAGGWRHDSGSKGSCANGCCEFKPPLKKSKTVEHPTWFEGSDCSAVPAELNNAPLFFEGSEGEVKSACIQTPEGDFVQVENKISKCGGRCCILVNDKQ